MFLQHLSAIICIYSHCKCRREVREINTRISTSLVFSHKESLIITV